MKRSIKKNRPVASEQLYQFLFWTWCAYPLPKSPATMNTAKFDWLNQFAPMDKSDNDILRSLGLEINDLTTAASTPDLDVKYLFNSAQILQSVSSKSGSRSSTDGDSPRLLSTSNIHFTTMPVFDGDWLQGVDQVVSSATTKTKTTAPFMSKGTKTISSNPRKMRVNKRHRPIFVTESPQNAYKKKAEKATLTTGIPHTIFSTNKKKEQQQHDYSPPSTDFGDNEGIDISRLSAKQHMTAKERRQLRNKISARKFRVRRKEYIVELENTLDEQDDKIDSLKQENKRLASKNQLLLDEVMRLRIQQQSTTLQPEHTSLPQNRQDAYSPLVSPPNTLNNLLDFGLFDNKNTYLSYSLMPSPDLSTILGDKLRILPSSLELDNHHQKALTMYPLLAPALASIVLRHTFSLHYAAYLTNAFPYNATTRPKNELIDIMRLDDWISAASDTSITSPLVASGGGDDDPDKNGSGAPVPSHRVEQQTGFSTSILSSTSNTWTEDFERQVLQQHYPYYALMRLRGLSHNEIIQRCRANMERRLIVERQQRMKAAASCSKLQTLRAFTSVASTLVRHPSRSPMVAVVIQNTKACQVTYKNGGTRNQGPFTVTSSVRNALKIGGSKS
ncbi:hypothetical protein BC941DRAFT_467905 [Chlamydoabsidia padenii]|nr:hypothetical protein BC941DRAFT_467905 [Chlamydoabsidia padenii]